MGIATLMTRSWRKGAVDRFVGQVEEVRHTATRFVANKFRAEFGEDIRRISGDVLPLPVDIQFTSDWEIGNVATKT